MKGIKHDKGKRRWHLMPWNALDLVVDVFTYGADLYQEGNWKLVEINRYKSAAIRHWSAYMQGEWLDSESKLPHLAHFITNGLFILWLELKNKHNNINKP